MDADALSHKVNHCIDASRPEGFAIATILEELIREVEDLRRCVERLENPDDWDQRPKHLRPVRE